MKKIAFAAATAMIMIACTDEPSAPVQTDTPAVDSTATAKMTDPDVPANHYQPEELDKHSIIRKTRDTEIKEMTPSQLAEIFGMEIVGEESDLYSGNYERGIAKDGEHAHGAFSFQTKAPKTKEGTWHLYRYDGEMSYGKPAGDWKVIYMDYVESKPQQNLTITIPFTDETCGEVRVEGQILDEIALSDQQIDTGGNCSVATAVKMAMAEAQKRVDVKNAKKDKSAAK